MGNAAEKLYNDTERGSKSSAKIYQFKKREEIYRKKGRLDKLWNNITEKPKKKGEDREISDRFRKGDLVDLLEANTRLANLNTLEREGLDDYIELTGQKIDKYSRTQIESNRSDLHTKLSNDTAAYIDNNLYDMADALSDENKINLSYTFCPQKDMIGKNSKEFNKVVKIIRENKKELEMIENDEDNYLKEALKGESELMRTAIIRNPKSAFLDIQKQKLTYELSAEIQKYDKNHNRSFLEMTARHTRDQNEKITEKLKKYQEDVQKVDVETKSSRETERETRRTRDDFERSIEKYQDGRNMKDLIKSFTKGLVGDVEKERAKKAEEKGDKYTPRSIEIPKAVGKTFKVSSNYIKGEHFE